MPIDKAVDPAAGSGAVGMADALDPGNSGDPRAPVAALDIGVADLHMRFAFCLCLLLAGIGLLPGADPAPARAQDLFTDQEWSSAQKSAAPASGTAATGVGTAATLLGGLVLVVGVAVGLGYLLKRLNARRLLTGRSRHLEVLETVSVAPRRSLALVRCGGHWLVVGLGEREMVAVATLPAPPEPGAGAAPAEAPAPPPPPSSSAFAGELGRLLGKP